MSGSWLARVSPVTASMRACLEFCTGRPEATGVNQIWMRLVSRSFSGLSRVKQHQAVYAALGGRMGGVLHALQLTTAAE